MLVGEGRATRKYDGTCVFFDEYERWWARREVKPGKDLPQGFQPVDADPVTGKTVGWVPIDQSPFAAFHAEALLALEKDADIPGRICGPKINGNPEHLTLRITVRSAEREGSYWRVTFAPDADEKLRDLLDDTPILLARGGGYSSHDEIDAGELMTPFEKDLEKARRAAREGRRGRDLEKVRAVAQEATKCRDVMRSMKQANRLRRIESDLEKLYAEVSADGAATVASSDRAAVNTPHYSGVTQSGTVGVVCSQAA